jgi:hypothetical protein
MGDDPMRPVTLGTDFRLLTTKAAVPGSHIEIRFKE